MSYTLKYTHPTLYIHIFLHLTESSGLEMAGKLVKVSLINLAPFPSQEVQKNLLGGLNLSLNLVLICT